jgi:type II secretory pathway pseudopilin PulG
MKLTTVTKKYFQGDKSLTGFTLIELIISTAIFMLIIGVAVVIFVYVAQHQRRILADQELMNQISYVQEYMSKALRMAKTASSEEDNMCLEGNDADGYIYLLTRPDSQTGFFKGIKFINQSDNDSCHEIFLDNITDPDNPVLKELKNTENENSAVALTSKNLKIEFVRFGINGENGSVATSPNSSGNFAGAKRDDDRQPRVTVILGVKILSDAEEKVRIFQTTISQRNLNVK